MENIQEESIKQGIRSTGNNPVKESFAEISALPTDTVLEIGKRENKDVLSKVKGIHFNQRGLSPGTFCPPAFT
jgi:hypothetical protein